jgi:glycosyltransferase involved in cell wall biosynthesis
MKILHLIKMSGIGGVQNQFETFLNYIEKNNIDIENLVLSLGGVEEHYRESFKNTKTSWGSVLWTLLRNRKNIIHSYNNLTSSKYYSIFKLLRPKKLVFHERGNCWNFQDNIKVVQKNALLAKCIIVNSYATKSMLVKRYELPEKKIIVIHNGVVSDESADLNKVKNTQEKLIIGYIGRIETNKGIQSLIEGVNLLEKSEKDKVEVQIWGDGALLNILKDYALNKGPIHFLGRIKDPFEAIKNFDLMIIPSIREPFGNVAVEAGILKIPVIASNIDGLNEIIEDKINGVLITPDEPVDSKFISPNVPLPKSVVSSEGHRLVDPCQIKGENLTKAIREFMGDSELYENYANELNKKVIRVFHISTYTEKVINVYRNL